MYRVLPLNRCSTGLLDEEEGGVAEVLLSLKVTLRSELVFQPREASWRKQQSQEHVLTLGMFSDTEVQNKKHKGFQED